MNCHPLAALFPMMADAECQELANDIKENGQNEPIYTFEGKILDGRNRFRACKMAGVMPELKEYTGKDPTAFVLSKNLKRRHLTDSQRAMVAANLANLKHGQKKSDTATAVSQSESAAKLSVSVDSVGRAKQVIESGSSTLVKAVESGEVSVRAAAVVAQLPKGEQRAVVRAGPESVQKAAAEIRASDLCPKCTRLGKTKDCPQCAALKAEKKAGSVKPGAMKFDWAKAETEMGVVIRHFDRIADGYELTKHKGEHKTAHELLDAYVNHFMAVKRRLTKS